MGHRPPFARMRDIKRKAVTVRADAEAAAAAEMPASVDEALEAEAASKPVSEPAPEASPKPKPEAVIEAAPEDDATPEPEDGEDDDAPEAANMDMKRSELNALAEEAGVDSPGDLPNKQAVIDAINAAQGDG